MWMWHLRKSHLIDRRLRRYLSTELAFLHHFLYITPLGRNFEFFFNCIMPQVFLKIKADLENIKCLTPVKNNYWKFDIQTPTGGDERKGITVCEEDLQPLDGSRGDAHFIIKWPYTNDQAYIKIVSHRGVKPSYNESNSGEYVTILALECRNIEITAWHPSEDFIIRTANDTIFDKVDLSDRDWAEYDEEHDATVSVSNLEYKIDNEP